MLAFSPIVPYLSFRLTPKKYLGCEKDKTSAYSTGVCDCYNKAFQGRQQTSTGARFRVEFGVKAGGFVGMKDKGQVGCKDCPSHSPSLLLKK